MLFDAGTIYTLLPVTLLVGVMVIVLGRLAEMQERRMAAMGIPSRRLRQLERARRPKLTPHERNAQRALARREWAEVIGMERTTFLRRMAVYGVLGFVLGMLLTGSPVMAILSFAGVIVVGQFWARRRLSAWRARVIHEVLPAAAQLSESLRPGTTNLLDAISSIAKRGVGRTNVLDARYGGEGASIGPIVQIFRRVATSQSPLHIALLEEQMRATSPLLREFLGILAHSADPAYNESPQVTGLHLQVFNEIESRGTRIRELAFAKAAQARGARILVFSIVPLTLSANLIATPNALDTLLHTTAGNIVLATIAILMGTAWFITENLLELK